MVFYFKARPEAGDYTIFMGLDKFENEELIKHGFPEDIWFHVDKMSSAHVYVRLHKGQTIDDISEGLLEDCAQLVKENSIQGNKVNNIDVVYTPWQNLKKTPSMDVGQVGFHNSKGVRTVRVEKRINEVVNRLNRTKVERTPDLKGRTSETPPNDSGEGQTTVAVSGELLSTANTSASNEYAEVTHANGDNSPNNSSSNSSLSKALTSIISSVIRDFDSQAEETIRSQDQLSFAIDRLTRELDELLEDAPSPFIMQHAVKISSVRKRVSSLNAVLKSIQRRVDNIDRLLSAGLPSGTFLPY